VLGNQEAGYHAKDSRRFRENILKCEFGLNGRAALVPGEEAEEDEESKNYLHLRMKRGDMQYSRNFMKVKSLAVSQAWTT
jgi:hypothetical protein